jgi:iron(III) transport system substrate-binding protein
MLSTIRTGLLAGAMAVIATCAFAQPKTVAEIAQYKGPDRQKIFEEGARKEGRIMIYATGTQADPVYKAFGEKFPFIKVEALRQDSSLITRRLLEEYNAGTFNADALQLNTTGLHPLREAGVLQPYYSPEVAAFDPAVVEKNNHWVIDYESYLSLGYNTNLVSEADAPKTLDDLLDPKWKGKMAMPGTTTLANWIGAVLKEKDEAYLRKLGQQNIRIYEVSARAVANLIISGEVALSPAIYNSHVANSREASNAPIAWRAISGVYPTNDGAVIVSRAPHPFAAMLFVDFVLSQEGQKILMKLGYTSARKDLPGSQRPSKIYYLGDDPNYLQNYEKWIALGRQVFGSGKAP